MALKARSSPKVCEIFKILYDLPSEHDLVMQLQVGGWVGGTHTLGPFLPSFSRAPLLLSFLAWAGLDARATNNNHTTAPHPHAALLSSSNNAYALV